MRLLELFSGTKSISKVAKTLGWDAVSLDIDSTHDPDLCMCIMKFDQTQYDPDHFDFIWASCPCEAYSIARTVAIIPRDDAMEASDKLLVKTRQIIEYFGCAYCIENPATSGLWKRDVAKSLEAVITSYCCFGYAYRKDTKLASNFPLVLPRCPGKGKCPSMIGTRHREHAQKGGGGSMPRYKSRDELHSIPEGLVCEICRHVNEWTGRMAQESGSESDSTDNRESKRAKNILDSSCSWGKMVKNEYAGVPFPTASL